MASWGLWKFMHFLFKSHLYLKFFQLVILENQNKKYCLQRQPYL